MDSNFLASLIPLPIALLKSAMFLFISYSSFYPQVLQFMCSILEAQIVLFIPVFAFRIPFQICLYPLNPQTSTLLYMRYIASHYSFTPSPASGILVGLFNFMMLNSILVLYECLIATIIWICIFFLTLKWHDSKVREHETGFSRIQREFHVCT